MYKLTFLIILASFNKTVIAIPVKYNENRQLYDQCSTSSVNYKDFSWISNKVTILAASLTNPHKS